MIQAVLVELESVACAGGPPAHAREALGALRALEGAPGHALALAFVGSRPTAEAALERLRARESGQLGADLASITTHVDAGASLPDRRVIQAALRRLGVPANLRRAAIVLASPQHAAACASLGAEALAVGRDFSDWRDLPLLVAARIDPARLRNLAVAVGPWLGPDLEEVAVLAAEPGAIRARARVWAKLPAAGLPEGVHAALPVEVVIRLDGAGRATAVEAAPPVPGALGEAASYAEGLFARGEVATEGASSAGATHVLETDARGRRLLKRARYSR